MFKRLSLAFILAGFGFLPPAGAQAPTVQARLTTIGDAVSLELAGRKTWNYRLTRSPNGMVLRLAGVTPEELTSLKSWKGPFLTKVQVEPGPDGGSEVRFQTNISDLDAFDYLSDQPSRLVVDFFRRPADEPKLVGASKVPDKKEVARQVAKLPAKKASARTPASNELLRVDEQGSRLSAPPPKTADLELPAAQTTIDGADEGFERFLLQKYDISEEAVLRSRDNIYLKFPALRAGTDLLENLLKAPPIYEIKAVQADPENEQARLLRTLFQNKRYSAFLKTLNDFFAKEYPESRYNEIIGYMEADAYFELWKQSKKPSDQDQALSKYRILTEKYPNSPLRERTQMIVALSLFSRGDFFNALQAFERYLRDNPQSKYRPQIQIAMAKNYVGLKDFNRAYELLEKLKADKTAGEFQIEATYQIGDVAFDQKNYLEALSFYNQARTQYPNDQLKFPNASFNRAESSFLLGRYEDSLRQYVEFLQKFGRHDHAGYAMTRVGEILEILGAPERQIAGAYLETLFRYNESEGAGVSRVRLLARRMASMKAKEVEESKKMVDEFARTSTLPKVLDFVTLMMADGYDRRGEHDRALNLLIGFYQQHPTTDMDGFRARILRNIAKNIETEIENGRFLGAMNIYGQYAPVWLKSSPRIDVEYYLGRAYEQAGVPSEAVEYYKRALNRLYSVQGTDQEKLVKVQETLPSAQSLNLRLAAMSVAQGDFAKAGRFLASTGDGKDLNSRETVERVSLTAQIEEERGNAPKARAALQELVSHWKGLPKEVAAPLLRLAELDHRSKDYSTSLDSIERILILDRDTQQVPLDLVHRALELQGNNLLELGRLNDAIASFQRLLERADSGARMESTRYQLGGLYFKKGDLVTAEKEWRKLPADSIWAKLANEQTKNAKWQDEHKKYINRIPAMATGEKKDGKSAQ